MTRNLGEYISGSAIILGRGLVYVGKEIGESFSYAPAVFRAMRFDSVGAEEEFEEVSRRLNLDDQEYRTDSFDYL